MSIQTAIWVFHKLQPRIIICSKLLKHTYHIYIICIHLIYIFYYHTPWLVKGLHYVTKIMIEGTQLMVLLMLLHCQQILITNSNLTTLLSSSHSLKTSSTEKTQSHTHQALQTLAYILLFCLFIFCFSEQVCWIFHCLHKTSGPFMPLYICSYCSFGKS